MSATFTPSQGMHMRGAATASRGDLLSMMQDVELLANLNDREAELLLPYLRILDLDAGCVLFKEGEPGDFMCLLVRGRVGIHKSNQDDDSVLVTSERRGRSVGEMALIDGEPRSATCVATEPGVVLLLTRESFHQLGADRPALALKVMERITRLLSRRLRQASGRLADFLDH